MHSVHNIFIFISASLAVFTSAAPSRLSESIAVPGAASVPGNPSGIPFTTDATQKSTLSKLDQRNSDPGNIHDVPAVPYFFASPLNGVSTDATTLVNERDTQPSQSLVVILQGVEADLTNILQKTTAIIDVHADVDIAVFTPIIDDIIGIFARAIVNVKALADLPLSVVLAVSGKVATVVDVAGIIHRILALVGTILVLITRAVGAARLDVIQPAIAGLGDVLAELLSIVIDVVNDLLPVLVPLLIDIVSILRQDNLGPVLDVLKIV
jgi:hypothetical protein